MFCIFVNFTILKEKKELRGKRVEGMEIKFLNLDIFVPKILEGGGVITPRILGEG